MDNWLDLDCHQVGSHLAEREQEPRDRLGGEKEKKPEIHRKGLPPEKVI